MIVRIGLTTNTVMIFLFGLFVSGTTLLIMWGRRLNLATGDLKHPVAVERTNAQDEP